jgi:hypothetical protein
MYYEGKAILIMFNDVRECVMTCRVLQCVDL